MTRQLLGVLLHQLAPVGHHERRALVAGNHLAGQRGSHHARNVEKADAGLPVRGTQDDAADRDVGTDDIAEDVPEQLHCQQRPLWVGTQGA